MHRISSYSITSSASASSVGGTSMPSVRAVCRLITSSNLVGCMTGRSEGFSPLYGALKVKHYFTAFSTSFITIFFVRLEIPFLRPDPHVLEAGAHRGCQGRPSLSTGHTLRRYQAAP